MTKGGFTPPNLVASTPFMFITILDREKESVQKVPGWIGMDFFSTYFINTIPQEAIRVEKSRAGDGYPRLFYIVQHHHKDTEVLHIFADRRGEELPDMTV